MALYTSRAPGWGKLDPGCVGVCGEMGSRRAQSAFPEGHGDDRGDRPHSILCHCGVWRTNKVQPGTIEAPTVFLYFRL